LIPSSVFTGLVTLGMLLVFSPLLGANTLNPDPSAQPDPASHETPPSADAFRVLPSPGPEAPEITSYLQYQTSLAWSQDELRRARWSQVKTAADLQRLRASLKQSVLDMIGGLPKDKTDLHASIVGTLPGRGFRIEKLIYQSLPGLYVTALVYVPENNAKVHPAVLVPAGHAANGKIHYQELAQRLVLRGYLVISWDPVGQGERSQFWDAKAGNTRYNLICAEHAVMGNLAYLAGANLARWEIWDGMRAVDYLLARPDVDPHRISITGTSGGGFQAALIGALDDRIQVVIPSCYITSLPMRVANRIFADPDSDPEQDLFGFISRGVDHAGLLLMMYPRPVMVATVTLDFFPVQGAYRSFAEARTFYERFGHADRIRISESYNTHQYSLHNQEAALEFLDRFNRMPLRHGLPPVTSFAEADLRVTHSGQVSVDFPDAKPLLSFITEYANERRPAPHTTLASMYAALEDPQIASWTVGPYNGTLSAKELRWEAVGTTTAGSVRIDRYLLHHSTSLAMPMLHIHDDKAKPRGTVIWTRLEGKATEKDWPQVAAFLHDGYQVYSFDFRGLGESRMNYRARSEDDPQLLKQDFDQAYADPLSGVLADYVYNSLLTGRPYFLQLMDDLKIAALFIRSQSDRALPIKIAAVNDAHSLAARFTEIDPDIQLLPDDHAPSFDWAELVKQQQEQWPIVYVLPFGASLQGADRRRPSTPAKLNGAPHASPSSTTPRGTPHAYARKPTHLFHA
jgi:Acetyl xylan esterase (AXE1)